MAAGRIGHDAPPAGRNPFMSWSTAAFLLDLSSWAHRAWHAVPPGVRAPTGEPAHMIHGCASMLVKLLAEKDPAWLVAAADPGGPTWRHEIFPAYKAARPPHPEGFDAQLAEVVRLLSLHRIPVVSAARHEADDVIATLTKRFRAAGIPVVIVGMDKDLRQLVTDTWPGVVMWDGRDKVTTARAIREEWGIEPDRVGDFLALVGDDGDGIPGVRGAGPKRAVEMMAETRDIEGIINLRQWGTTAAARALRRGVEQVRLSRRLVALRDDVPITVELAACALGDYDVPGLRGWYERWGLARLAGRMEEGRNKQPPDEATLAAWGRFALGG